MCDISFRLSWGEITFIDLDTHVSRSSFTFLLFVLKMGDRVKSTLSFGFTKRTEAKKLQSSAIKDNDYDKKEETDYLVSLEDNEIKRFVAWAIMAISPWAVIKLFSVRGT